MSASEALFNSSYHLSPFTVLPIQSKLNRIIRNYLLPASLIPETGALDTRNISALQCLCQTYALDNPKPLAAGTERIIFPSKFPRNLSTTLNPVNQPFARYRLTQNPLPDLAPDSLTVHVLQWLVDHSDGPISQMSPASHIALAKRCSEIISRFPPTLPSCYEDFDVYEPFELYLGKKDADNLIKSSRENAIKKPGFQEPARKPGQASAGNRLQGDGARFKGRGFVQLTHRDNYVKADEDLNLGLVDHPEKANSPDISAKTMIWFLATGRVLNFSTVRTALAANDTMTLRQAVNGKPRHPRPGYLPAGFKNFINAYWAGKAFMYQAFALKHSRLGLQPAQLFPSKAFAAQRMGR